MKVVKVGTAPAVPADLKGDNFHNAECKSQLPHVAENTLLINTGNHSLQRIIPKTCSPACPAVKLGVIDLDGALKIFLDCCYAQRLTACTLADG